MKSGNKPLFRSIVKKNKNTDKVLFYLTSYAFPWWVYALPISRFKKMGYEVVVYDFANEIIHNNNPKTLPETTDQLVTDILKRQNYYRTKGIKTFHGIGNSLGSYLIFNYGIRRSLDAIILNGGGSIADVIYNKSSSSWNNVAEEYSNLGYDKHKLQTLWSEYDLPELGQNIKADKVLVMYSVNDGTIPLESSLQFVEGLRKSGKEIATKTDKLPHVFSVINNSLKVKKLYKFLNS